MTKIPRPPKDLVYCLVIVIAGVVMLAAYLKYIYP
jgi:hypothetical protein